MMNWKCWLGHDWEYIWFYLHEGKYAKFIPTWGRVCLTCSKQQPSFQYPDGSKGYVNLDEWYARREAHKTRIKKAKEIGTKNIIRPDQ